MGTDCYVDEFIEMFKTDDKNQMKSMRTFYVCSWGGSGSTMLCEALKKYGNTEHIHSRVPPSKLEYIGKNGGGDTYCEWFNGKRIPDENLEDYTVIFIYRNPCLSIPSRFTNPKHLKHVQLNSKIKLRSVIEERRDLYKIEEFYRNYVEPKEARNYKVIVVKYEDIFEKQQELSEILGVGELNIVNKSNRTEIDPRLAEIYSGLIKEMGQNPFIMMR